MLTQSHIFARSLRHHVHKQCYSTSSVALKSASKSKEVRLKVAADYNNRRATYKRAVSKLRKQYADEVAQQRITDEKAQAQRKAEQTRKRLERQRIKNIQSVKNAMRAEEARQKRANEFEEELKVAQTNREARAEKFDKARRLLVQELEEEAPYWLSNTEEVDAAFDGLANEQKLWSRPGGFVGAPMPSEDAEFWRYESHTWDMKKTYKTARETVLEDIEEMAYYDANFNPAFWDDDQINFQSELEQKAKLRALVREEGRKALLLKQRQMMQDIYAEQNKTGPDGVPPLPSAMPVPSLDVLVDYEAMEKEGVKILEKDPTKFFVFDEAGEKGDHQGGHTLGKPVRLVDPVRDSSPTGTPYPELLGRLPKPDTRTDREKKRQEREERMWAAAQEEASASVEFAADDEIPLIGDPVDYNKLENEGDEDDLAWEQSVDPELRDTPRDQRFTEEDYEWLTDTLNEKIALLDENIKLDSKFGESAGGGKNEVEEALGSGTVKSKGVDKEGREYTTYDVLDDDEDKLLDLMRMQDTSILETLNAEQLTAIEALDGERRTADEIKESLSKVPGLTDDQVQALVDLEISLQGNFFG